MDTREVSSRVARGDGAAIMDPAVVDIEGMAQLIARYPSQGPRYTSYPTAVEFTDAFGESDLIACLERSRTDNADADLSIYLHLPFCQHLCFYCGCNKVLTRNAARGVTYLSSLYREMDLWRRHLGGDRRIRQMHLGGGTPTFFTLSQLEDLVENVGRRFRLDAEAGHDYSIEIDPRTVDVAYVRALADIGFNRLSIGVQDFDPDVQRAVHRVQDADEVEALVAAARTRGIDSINFDLIYGLPRQNVDSFGRTLERVIECLPDRLSVYQYAHLPERFAPQRRIVESELPSLDTRMALHQLTIDMLSRAGYVYIGMDHFARPGDSLVRAMEDGSLRRSFQGYTTHRDHELVGMGVSSIGEIGGCLYQNAKTLEQYYAAVDAGSLAVERGVTVTRDDHVRRDVIMDVMCHGVVDKQRFAAQTGTDFDDYFREIGSGLKTMVADGLVRVTPSDIIVTARGRFMLRNIAMLFDRYRGSPGAARFSRTV